MTKKQDAPLSDTDLKKLMSDDMCFAMRARRLSRLLTRRYEDELRDSGLTVPQFTLLAAIIKHEPIAPADLGLLLDIEKSTLSRTVAKMIRNNWLEEKYENKGRKGLATTGPGRERLREASASWKAIQLRAVETFGPNSDDMLDRMIDMAHKL